jgi:transcriptional regulator with XRE-family HTH domain
MSRTEHRKDIIQRFGEKLHALRIARGLTLNELAQAIGYRAHGYISELESGKKLPTVELAVIISKLFNVTTDQLLRDELDLPELTKEEI